MSKMITTGPFHVPFTPDPNSGNNNGLNIVLKNHTDSTRTVQVRVDRCTSVVFPATSLEGPPVLPDTTVTLQPDQCTIVSVGISPFTILRVRIEGDIDLDAKKIEVSVTGGILFVSAGLVQFADPTLFFRHDDFVEEK